MPGWKFLTNHTLVLLLIAQQSRITARGISSVIGITEKATRNIIDDLETEGYIAKKKEGRRLHYTVTPDLSLRAETQQDKTIGDLLRLLGWKKRTAR
jgi:predicted ArsR family transcriptional regulator